MIKDSFPDHKFIRSGIKEFFGFGPARTQEERDGAQAGGIWAIPRGGVSSWNKHLIIYSISPVSDVVMSYDKEGHV